MSSGPDRAKVDAAAGQVPGYSPTPRVRRLSLGLGLPNKRWRFFLLYCLETLFAYGYVILRGARPGFWVGPHDFTSFYTGALMLRQGLGSRLYDLAAQAQVQQALLRPYGWVFADGLLPYIYPPFLAVLFVPLTWVSLQWAFILWNLANLALIITTVALLLAQWRRLSPGYLAISTVIALAFIPVFQGVRNGQSSFLVLLALTLTYVAQAKKHEALSGLALAFGLIKPQLVVLFVLWLLVRRRWRALLAFGAAAIALLFVSCGITGSDGLMAYLPLTRQMLAWDGRYGIYPAVMPNLRGTVVRLSHLHQAWQGSPPSTLATMLANVLFALPILWLLFLGWRTSRQGSMGAEDLCFAQTISAGLLLSPHLYGHDLSLLVLGGFLLTRRLLAAGRLRAAWRVTVLGHAGLFVSVYLGMDWQAQVGMLLLLGLMVFTQMELASQHRSDVAANTATQSVPPRDPGSAEGRPE